MLSLIVAIAIMAVAPVVGAQTKPRSTWQTAYPNGMLKVHVSADPNSEVYFFGAKEDYDGTATYPSAPTSEHLTKRRNGK